MVYIINLNLLKLLKVIHFNKKNFFSFIFFLHIGGHKIWI